MIGQPNLHSRIEKMVADRTFPRFSIFVGPRGSGKKLFATEIKEMFNKWNDGENYIYAFRAPDVKVDTVRGIITQAYKTATTSVYIIPDADSMSNAAKNALLKVTEEPPNNAYIIMTLEDENNTLDTIRSRGTIFHMDRYTPGDILDYARTVFGMDKLDASTRTIITDLCETPGDVNILHDCGIYEFYEYVQLVVENITEVSLANAFKISDKIALKDGDEGYDLRLFWKAFIKACFASIPPRCETLCTTAKYLRNLQITGVNRQMLFDRWVLAIRVPEL